MIFLKNRQISINNMIDFKVLFKRLDKLLLVLFIVFAFSYHFSLASDFEQSKQKIQYLVHLRKNYPEIYRDFITRYNAFEFLDTAQSAIETLNFKNSPIDSYSWDVYGRGSAIVKRIYDIQNIRNEIFSTLNFTDKNINVINLIADSAVKASKYEAITAGLAQTPTSLGLRDILRLPPEERLIELANKVGDLPNVIGVSPRLLGLNQESISGKQLIALYSESILARKVLSRLVWLLQLTSDFPNQQHMSLDVLMNYLKGLHEKAVSEKMGQKMDPNNLTELNKFDMGKTGIIKILKNSVEELKKFSTVENEVAHSAYLFQIFRSHPYDYFPRGSVGDCSTTNCFPISLVKKEEFFWIRRADGSIKGYFQFTRLIVNGKIALYLNTISGAGISREDAKAVFHTVATSLKQLGAEKIVIPLPEKIPFIINFPEVQFVYNQFLSSGKIVEVTYLDEGDRLKLLPFTEDSLDLPEKNKQAIEINLQEAIDPKFKAEIHHQKISTNHSFPLSKSTEVLMVLLELRNRDQNISGINESLKTFNIDKSLFEELWRVVSNDNKMNIERFHQETRKILDALKIEYTWNDFVTSPLFFRGHMKASDALIGNNKNMAMRYIDILLKSFSDIPDVYQILSHHYKDLILESNFVDLVKNLFKKNLKEFDRLLDYYELEHRSAYRTLAFLFESGLPRDLFAKEIEVLSQPWENEITDVVRSHGVFFRRVTLLGIISNFHPQYFNKLMDHLEKVARSNVKLNEDDIRTVVSYMVSTSNKGKLSPQQNARMESFLTLTELGMSFLPHLGIFSIEHLNVPKFIEVLFKNEKYEWAAQLIHKGFWITHPQAPLWIKRLWENRDKLSADLLLLGFQVNPNLLKMPEISKFIDDLMEKVRGNSHNEMALAKIILSQPERMSSKRLSWLGSLSNPDIRDKLTAYKNAHKEIRINQFLIKIENDKEFDKARRFKCLQVYSH